MVTAVTALNGGDIRLLWRLTILYDLDEGAPGNWTNVLPLSLAGGVLAWALWQTLRGPAAGRPPLLDPGTRLLRTVLYVNAASWGVRAFMPVWPWWAGVCDLVLMLALMLAFQPALRRNVRHADLALLAGASSLAVLAADEVFGWRNLDLLAALLLAGLLIWTVLVFVAQRRDGRWGRATILYGVASLLGPFAVMFAGNLPYTGSALATAADAMMVIWLARSAHDLAHPDTRPVPLPPPLARPPMLAAALAFTACVAPIVPAVINLNRGHPLWITPYAPIGRLMRRAGDFQPMLGPAIEVFELFVGVGGPALVVLVAVRLRTRLALLAAIGTLLLTAGAGLAALALSGRRGPGRDSQLWNMNLPLHALGLGRAPVATPVWIAVACVLSAVLLWWTHTLRRHEAGHLMVVVKPAPRTGTGRY
ncbi:hypothetical protein [Nonomuraea sp. NPDC002799]